MPGKKTKPKSWTEIWKSLIALVPVGICITLYLARPYLETSHNPIISCVICDNQQDIRPPTSSHDYGATVELTIENTGSSATRIVEHNLSWWSAPETLSLPFTGLPESRDTNDDLEVPIGAHSSKILKMGLNEATIYILRHPMPMGSTIGPVVKFKAYVYGHVAYKLYGLLPTTTEFCFQYVPPTKGLPESWMVCPNDVHVNR